MDALEFAREKRRLCNTVGMCESCPLDGLTCAVGEEDCTDDEDEQVIEIVEKWSKEHPRKTRQSEMLKLFPDTILDGYGVVDICPLLLGRYRGGCEGEECHECREKWWGEEIE